MNKKEVTLYTVSSEEVMVYPDEWTLRRDISERGMQVLSAADCNPFTTNEAVYICETEEYDIREWVRNVACERCGNVLRVDQHQVAFDHSLQRAFGIQKEVQDRLKQDAVEAVAEASRQSTLKEQHMKTISSLSSELEELKSLHLWERIKWTFGGNR